jgi:hypothetical protein
VSYTKFHGDWKSDPDPSTPVTDTALEHIETGISDAAATADSALASATAKYTKPGGGIPASDLATAVQTSLGKADTALQFDVPAPSGTASVNTAAIQAALDAASAAGGGVVRLRPGANYSVTGVTIGSNVVLDLNNGGLTLSNAANAPVVSVASYASLIAGDTTGGPTDFGVQNGYLDGNKSNQSATAQPVLAIYGRRYTLSNLMVRNGKGTGIDSQWSTTSSFQSPNGFESFVTQVYVHSCDGDGINFRGPHDTFFSNFFIVKCGVASGSVPLRFPDASGRANGSNVQQFHVYGGNGYNYGLLCNTAGMRFSNFVVEGGQLAQVLVQASQVMLDGFHLYTGGVATATAKGLVIGDASHTGINGSTIRGRVENCGGGVADVTYMGWNNDLDLHHYYISGTTPTQTDLGITGTLVARNKVLLRATDAVTSFAGTSVNEVRHIGILRADRANSADTRDPFTLRNESGDILFRIDWRGRPRAATNTGAPIATIAAGAQAGTGATVTITGNDIAGKVRVTTGTSPAAGTLASITFSGVFGNAPYVVLTPKDVGAAALQVYNGTATSGFSVKSAVAPAASTQYEWDYMVVGA